MKRAASDTALGLALLAQDPAILAALLPEAAKSYVYRSGPMHFQTTLLPADARRLACLTREAAMMVSVLTDDPEALGLLATSWEHPLIRERAALHPNTPIAALVSMGFLPYEKEHLLEGVLQERMHQEEPSAGLLQLCLEQESKVALRCFLLHPTLAAPEALRCLEVERVEVLEGRDDLVNVLSRSTSGGEESEDTLVASISSVVSRIPAGSRWYSPGGGRSGAVARALAISPCLGQGGLVSRKVAEALGGSEHSWEDLLGRSDLSGEACAYLAQRAWESARLRASGDLDALLKEEHYEAREARAGLAKMLCGLSESPECPREVLEDIPVFTQDLRPLARLLPADPRAWEVAAALVAEDPLVTFGELAHAASAVVK